MAHLVRLGRITVAIILTAAPVTGAISAERNMEKPAFASCTACHDLHGDTDKPGPDLRHLDGRQAGSLAGYRFSSAMRHSGITWNRKTLTDFLTDPQSLVPGNKMPFSGVSSEQERREIVEYLIGGGQ
ncbi:c-type cytochrome [Gluconacetobacter sp. Hr-1-5]|uniref:c-type cytochrome n=1 Tax=Gluconacetobacter sp. Hr-1-5 TaxID=3395370 RepID=UPI003B515E32